MAGAESKIYTVSELTRGIKGILEQHPSLSGVWVKGEISNLTFHASGHIYFTLKDAGAVISAVFFRYANKNLSFKLEEGLSVLAFGSITVFEKRGSYQFNVASVRLEGIGELQKKIEQLKKRLGEEGIFDPSRRRPLPFLPRRLGIVTSPTGAALRDIIKVALRRYPNIEIVIAPAVVQGQAAPASIVRGIEELNRLRYGIDVIIAGRGGGSFEDLMPFNEEIVVRAFRASRVPIISAVGHQVDHPLCDDAADHAAPTPSAAAEIAVPQKKELYSEIDYLATRSRNALFSRLRDATARLRSVRERRVFRNPMEIVGGFELALSDAENRISGAVGRSVQERRIRLLALPDIRLLTGAAVQRLSHRYQMALNSLEQLSPLSTLRRGYGIAMNESERVIRSVEEVRRGDSLSLVLHDGTVGCSVNTVMKGGLFGKKEAAED